MVAVRVFGQNVTYDNNCLRAAAVTTVVFADLVGSTSMFERLGDGLFVVFPNEGDALAAARSARVASARMAAR